MYIQKCGELFDASALGLFAIVLAPRAATWPAKLGDLDADSQVTVLDLVRLLNHLNGPLGPNALPPMLRGYADANGDGYINQQRWHPFTP